jgi:L-ribulokinase
LLEATAFGNRQVLDLLEGAVVPIHEIRVSGGLTRSTLLMQLLADVLGRSVDATHSLLARARRRLRSIMEGDLQ